MNSVKYLSYINDILITTASISYNRNIKVLEREVKRLIKVRKNNAILFNIAKTELIHFTIAREAKRFSLTLLGDIKIRPKSLVKWLGIYFDRNLTFKEYVAGDEDSAPVRGVPYEPVSSL